MSISQKIVWCFIFLILTIIGMVIVSLLGKLFFASLLWVVGGDFSMTMQDIKQCMKIGFYGGVIGGGGIILFRIFNVKGF